MIPCRKRDRLRGSHDGDGAWRKDVRSLSERGCKDDTAKAMVETLEGFETLKGGSVLQNAKRRNIRYDSNGEGE